MTKDEWLALSGYAAVTLAVSFFSPLAAYGMMGILAVVAIVSHGSAIPGLFGKGNPPNNRQTPNPETPS